MRRTPSAASWRAISGAVTAPSIGSPSIGWPPVIATAPFTQDLVRDVDVRGDGGADREEPGVEVRAVAHVLEDVRQRR